jgi:hypothetical protein
LTKRIIDLEEATELNGVIVAPDQEKAYDKIEHNTRSARRRGLFRTYHGVWAGPGT